MKKNAQSLHDYIRLEAYLLSEKAGHPTGMGEFFWAQAEAIIHGRAAVVVRPVKASRAKLKTTKDTKKPIKPVAASKSQPTPKAVKTAKAAQTAKPKSKPAAKRAK